MEDIYAIRKIMGQNINTTGLNIAKQMQREIFCIKKPDIINDIRIVNNVEENTYNNIKYISFYQEVKMNIFEYDGEEFDKKLEEIFKDINKDELKKELIECGLEIQEEVELDIDADYYNKELEENSYWVHSRDSRWTRFVSKLKIKKKNSQENSSEEILEKAV